jgi:hypothetical protein
MVEGAVRHGTSMSLEDNYVDSHGQSEIGFGITRLLGFELLPRIKQIDKVSSIGWPRARPNAYRATCTRPCCKPGRPSLKRSAPERSRRPAQWRS